MNLKGFLIFIAGVVLVRSQNLTVGFSDQISNQITTESKGLTSPKNTGKNLDIEGIELWTDVGVDLSKIIFSEDSEALSQVIKRLRSAISYLKPILSGFVDMIGDSNKFNEIKEQLSKMDSHLFAVENKIDALVKLVTHSQILADYKRQAEKINLIEMSYRRYMSKNTNVTLNELVNNCQRNSPLDYVYYLHGELKGSRDTKSILPLMTVMKDDYNLANFQIWMKMLVGSLSQSMMLHTICMFAVYRDQPDLIDTMDGDISFLEEMSDIMMNVLTHGTNDIKENFFDQAKEEVHRYASSHFYDDHTDFSRNVWEMLVTKYFWRHWFVASYDDELYGEDYHFVTFQSRYVYAWFRKHKRNVNVVHTNNNLNKVEDKLKEILDGRQWDNINGNEKCKYVYEYVQKRIGGLNSLGVVDTGSSFSAKWSTGSAAVYYIRADGRGYNVFAVAPEN